MDKIFMWIFDYYTFSVKDIVEIGEYEINIDEETNANSTIDVLKKTTAKARDIIIIKKNNELLYWGIIDEIQNDDGKQLYQFKTKYMTNLFDRKIQLKASEQIINTTIVSSGLYVIKSDRDNTKAWDVYNLSTADGAEISLYTFNAGRNQYFEIIKQPNGHYRILTAHSHKYVTVDSDNYNVLIQYQYLDSDKQLWDIEKISTNAYAFKSVYNNKYVKPDDYNYLVATSGSASTSAVKFQLVKQSDEKNMQYIGVEDMIKSVIEANFTQSDDQFINLPWLDIEVLSHTPKQVSVSNVDNGIYNLHTWMTNCTQNYDVVYSFRISGTKVIMSIRVESRSKELIDTKAQSISNYNEVFETDIVSKVVVLYSKVNGVDNPGTYTLYLLNDRTTTTDGTDVNRADGKVETIYTENYEDANQEALNVMKSNAYNHNITFSLLDRYIPIGTPIAIKTKESIIYDTYISSVKISRHRFYEYICGNIRIRFIDKLMKERNE